MPDPSAEYVIREPVVLIVDDDRAVLEALSSLLAPLVEPLFRVETATSGEEALQIVSATTAEGRESPLALVISDEKMPGMSGNDLLVALRQHERHRHGGRILITGYAGLASAKRAINEAEVDKYFPKPWDAEHDLLPAVRQVLSRFVIASGLGNHLMCQALPEGAPLDEILTVRREWWLYANYLAADPEDPSSVPEVESFRRPEDTNAVHLVAWRHSAHGRHPAAAVALHAPRPATGNPWRLDTLCFWPEDISDRNETLVVRTALFEARQRGASVVAVEAPALRRKVYETLGFVAAPGRLPSDAAVPMVCHLTETPSPHHTRFEREASLCLCAQTGCPWRDYDLQRRSYYCPLDVHEGRVPLGFSLEAPR